VVRRRPGHESISRRLPARESDSANNQWPRIRGGFALVGRRPRSRRRMTDPQPGAHSAIADEAHGRPPFRRKIF